VTVQNVTGRFSKNYQLRLHLAQHRGDLDFGGDLDQPLHPG